MNEVERAEILLDTYHQMASPVTEIAKMFKEHAEEAMTEQRETNIDSALNRLEALGVNEDTRFEVEAAIRRGECNCHRCRAERREGGIFSQKIMMVVCTECGNKRCPKASDHRLECTCSNEPGQKGSIYEQ